jgi:hypothetical protein
VGWHVGERRRGKVCGEEIKVNRFFFVTDGMVGNFLPTLATPKIGGAPLEELQEKKWSGADFLWSGVEIVEVFGYFFTEWSQI